MLAAARRLISIETPRPAPYLREAPGRFQTRSRQFSLCVEAIRPCYTTTDILAGSISILAPSGNPIPPTSDSKCVLVSVGPTCASVHRCPDACDLGGVTNRAA